MSYTDSPEARFAAERVRHQPITRKPRLRLKRPSNTLIREVSIMHIETLKVFCDIIESGSVSYAASQNFVTQSAVSQQVRSLEDKYECRLLERARAGVKPTAAGQILYNSSKEIVRRFVELENRLREIGSIVGGAIRVGTVYSVGLHELPPYLSQFLRTYPQVN